MMLPLFLYSVIPFVLHSGSETHFKMECDALSDHDWWSLAMAAHESGLRFGSVEGVPRGGERFADALQQFATEGKVLIVDDVLTTGASMEEQRAGRDAIGLVLFARARPASWIKAIFHGPLFDDLR